MLGVLNSHSFRTQPSFTLPNELLEYSLQFLSYFEFKDLGLEKALPKVPNCPMMNESLLKQYLDPGLTWKMNYRFAYWLDHCPWNGSGWSKDYVYQYLMHDKQDIAELIYHQMGTESLLDTLILAGQKQATRLVPLLIQSLPKGLTLSYMQQLLPHLTFFLAKNNALHLHDLLKRKMEDSRSMPAMSPALLFKGAVEGGHLYIALDAFRLLPSRIEWTNYLAQHGTPTFIEKFALEAKSDILITEELIAQLLHEKKESIVKALQIAKPYHGQAVYQAAQWRYSVIHSWERLNQCSSEQLYQMLLGTAQFNQPELYFVLFDLLKPNSSRLTLDLFRLSIRYCSVDMIDILLPQMKPGKWLNEMHLMAAEHCPSKLDALEMNGASHWQGLFQFACQKSHLDLLDRSLSHLTLNIEHLKWAAKFRNETFHLALHERIPSHLNDAMDVLFISEYGILSYFKHRLTTNVDIDPGLLTEAAIEGFDGILSFALKKAPELLSNVRQSMYFRVEYFPLYIIKLIF